MKISLVNTESLDLETFEIGFYRAKNNASLPCLYPKANKRLDSNGRYIGEALCIPIDLKCFLLWLEKYTAYEQQLYAFDSSKEHTGELTLDKAWLGAALAVKSFATFNDSSLESYLLQLQIGSSHIGQTEKRSVYGYVILMYAYISNKNLKDCSDLASCLGYKTENGEEFTRQLNICVRAFKQHVKSELASTKVPHPERHPEVIRSIIYKLYETKKPLLLAEQLPANLLSALNTSRNQFDEYLTTEFLEV